MKKVGPIQEHIAFNKLYEEGQRNTLLYCKRSKAPGKDWQEFTKAQLDDWGVKFTPELGKEHYDKWIDDKAINDKEYFRNKRYTG